MLNFRKIPCAFIFSIGIVCACEIFINNKFEYIFFNHEVDFLVSFMKNATFDNDYVIIGDSVGLQLAEEFRDDFSVLATNKAVETAGQYFIIKRYLERNINPKAVIFLALPFLDNDLNQVYTENFILRVFTRPNEIIDILLSEKDISMTLKMIMYNVLFSYKNKLQIQKNILGHTNADIYSGFDIESQEVKYEDYSIIKIINKFKRKNKKKASVLFFEKLLSFLQKRNIKLYYIPVPISRENSYETDQYKRLFDTELPLLSRRYSNLHCFSEYDSYSKDMFVDGVHLTKDGLTAARKRIKNNILKIIERKN